MSSDTQYEKPTLDDAIKTIIRSALCEVHTSLPAKILSFDGKKAKVQIELKRQKTDGEEIAVPPILDVPVVWPATRTSSVTLPLSAGDTGMVMFSERSLDIWKTAGGTVNPNDPRKFNYSDAVFIPGLKDFSQASFHDPNRVIINNELGVLAVNKTGKFKMTNGTEEVLDLIIQLMDEVVNTLNELGNIHTVNTVFGLSVPNNFANYQSLKTLVETIKSKMETLEDI